MQEAHWKMRLLGNAKLIGKLVVRKMMSAKIVLVIIESLLHKPTPASLELLAALLTVVGPFFDKPESRWRPALHGFLAQVQSIIHDGACEPRARCLLQDLLDLRKSGWNNSRPKPQEQPTTLHDVAQRAAAEEGPGTHSLRIPPARLQPATHTPTPAPAARSMPLKPAPVARDARNEEMRRTFDELRISHDVEDAVSRLKVLGSLPLTEQADDLLNWLTMVIQEGQISLRKAGFRVVAELLLRRRSWEMESVHASMDRLLEDFHDLNVDVPGLCGIMKDELLGELRPLVKSGTLCKSKHASWLQAFLRITG
jgi:hypothetical protein